MITAKYEVTARLSLDSVGLTADELFADAHGPEKAEILTAQGVAVYVGDTPADMRAAVTAGAYPVGVATGSFTAEPAPRGRRGGRARVDDRVSRAVPENHRLTDIGGDKRTCVRIARDIARSLANS